jgi:hypothetical protein
LLPNWSFPITFELFLFTLPLLVESLLELGLVLGLLGLILGLLGLDLIFPWFDFWLVLKRFFSFVAIQ